MALPITGISLGAVRKELGAASDDLGTLCSHPNINKWSRWKPVRHSKVTGLTEADLMAVDFGLNIPAYTRIEDVLGKSIVYDGPRGGASEPFRLGDFRGYDHYVSIPLGTHANGLSPMYTILKNEADTSLMVGFYLFATDNNVTGILYNELYYGLAPLYLGIYLTNSAGQVNWATSATPFTDTSGATALTVQIDMMHQDIRSWTGDIKVEFFVTNVKKSQGTSYTWSTSDRFYPITNDSNNLNPFYVTLSYGEGVNTCFGYIKSYSYTSNPPYLECEVAYSSIGADYSGGTVDNAYVMFFADSAYNDFISSGNFGTFTLGTEEVQSFAIQTLPPSLYQTVYYQIFGNGRLLLDGAINY